MSSKSSQVQRRRKQPQDSSATVRRPSWRKQIRSFFSTPVELIRRIVLRKRPARPPLPVLPDDSAVNETQLQYAIQNAKRRRHLCYFLFLGLSQSGKSTTISKLFNGERPKSEEPKDRQFRIYKNESVGQNIGLEIVDTPGLIGKNTPEQDAEAIVALSSLLKRELPSRIPTVTFIVARLDDERFEGEQSDFSRMLKAIYLVKDLITDRHHSNLVLLLTHSEKATVQADDINLKIERYQDAFSKVFTHKDPVNILAIDNIRDKGKSESSQKRYHSFIFDNLRDLAAKRGEYSLLEMMNWMTGKSKRFSVSFQQEVVSAEALLPARRALVTRVFNNLMGNEISTNCLDSDDETEEETPKYEPYFVMYHTTNRKAKKGKKSRSYEVTPPKVLTCIPTGSQIVLANKRVINIEECLVGDKLLSLQNSPAVITSIKVAATLSDAVLDGSSVGSIYCSVKKDNAADTSSRSRLTETFIYTYVNETFRLVNASKANIPEKQSTRNLRFFELDSDDATFVVNGFPCFAQAQNY